MRDVSAVVGPRCSTVCFRPFSFRGNYACYSDYVSSDIHGYPEWEKTDIDASETLLSYLESLSKALQLPSLKNGRITLVGFSKGAVVLSALLKTRNRSLLEHVDKFIFIDPGLSVPGRLFPFTPEEYDLFPSEIPIEIYSTGYQMSDPERPWLRKEIVDFASRSGATLHPILSNYERNLDTHFKSITVAISTSFKDSY